MNQMLFVEMWIWVYVLGVDLCACFACVLSFTDVMNVIGVSNVCQVCNGVCCEICFVRMWFFAFMFCGMLLSDVLCLELFRV